MQIKVIQKFLSIIFISALNCHAQIPVTFNINTSLDRHSISPYIFGSNGQSTDDDENITARRLGGNRLTGYNWENNASNAGADWFHSSDDYLPWVAGIPTAQYSIPNVVYQAFHDTSIATNCYSLLTLPMAGYVAADYNGNVDSAQTAPSIRFKNVVNHKGSAFSINPDTTDANIYIDECLNNLIQHYGLGTNRVKGYSMDNEYALWNSTHPRIHPLQPTIDEVISKSINLSSTIKEMDSTAEVFGPADYGYASFLNFQSAPDWNNYSSYGNFINAYLNGMKHASDSVGRRLLDVVDVHWYPEAQGYDDLGNLNRVVDGPNDRGVAIARMQCPRTLFDSSYVENSWIGQWYSPCVYIRALKAGINNYFPGTKLAFTEFNYGGSDHISGGIAIADVLGIFSRYDVYMSNHWGPLEDYVSAAFKLYRNYDGNNSTYGDENVLASTNDLNNSSIYASVESSDSSYLHFIILNKNYDSSLTASVNINSNINYTNCVIWGFDSTSSTIILRGLINNISANNMTLSIPPLSAYHVILNANPNTSIDDLLAERISIYPNPTTGKIFLKTATNRFEWSIENILTSEIVSNGSGVNEVDITSFPNGFYLVRINTGKEIVYRKIFKTN